MLLLEELTRFRRAGSIMREMAGPAPPASASQADGYVEHGVYHRGGEAASPLLPGFGAVVAEVFDAPETGA